MSADPEQAMTDTRPWREQAVSAVVDALYARHPGLAQDFGQSGVQACRADIHHHLDVLDSALAANESALFTGYATWLNDVLHHRGVPGSHLIESFDLLAEVVAGFLADHLPGTHAERIRAILGAASAALRRGDLPSAYEGYARVPALADSPRYCKAAVSGRQALAQKLMSEVLQAGLTLSEACVRLIQPAMVEVGQLWQENRISVAQEHMATAISQNVMARAYLQGTFAPPVGRTAIFAGVAGNHHGLGLRMVADAFETIGWDVLYLGADVPTAALIRQVDGGNADLLALSLSLPSHLAAARETVERLRAELGSRCPPIWVGGRATQMSDRVWRSLKADGWAADALHALEQAPS